MRGRVKLKLQNLSLFLLQVFLPSSSPPNSMKSSIYMITIWLELSSSQSAFRQTIFKLEEGEIGLLLKSDALVTEMGTFSVNVKLRIRL